MPGVIEYGPLGKLFTFGMRVSTVLDLRPVLPVVSSLRSRGSNAWIASDASAMMLNGGAVSLFEIGPPTLGGGNVGYGPFLVGAILNVSVLVAWNCCALEKFGPGEPSSFSISCETRLSTASPDFGRHVA